MQSNGNSRKNTLAPALTIGPTELYVHSLKGMETYYGDIIGLDKLNSNDGIITLGYGKVPILSFFESNHVAAPAGSAGLYHNAIVFSSRGELARTVKKVFEKAPHTFSGTADHLVSEAFYFTDPEGNGLELYFDKDPATWQWQDGKIVMDSIYIDPIAYIQKYESLQEPQDKHMGHVHLKVGDIEQAGRFYIDILGFNETARLGSALFLSVGGYHHHLGMNTWESLGAGERTGSLGLKTFTLELPDEGSVKLLKDRLMQHTIQFQEIKSGIVSKDPWNNRIIVKKS